MIPVCCSYSSGILNTEIVLFKLKIIPMRPEKKCDSKAIQVCLQKKASCSNLYVSGPVFSYRNLY